MPPMPKSWTTIRKQKPVKGGRMRVGAGVLREIEREVEKLATRHKVSKSFVIAVALAKAFKIPDQEQY
jgi:hypothetical protein